MAGRVVALALRVNSGTVVYCGGVCRGTQQYGGSSGIGTRGVQQDRGVQLHGGFQGCAGCALAHKVCKSRRCVTALT